MTISNIITIVYYGHLILYYNRYVNYTTCHIMATKEMTIV
jgi:hypothetical protein